MEDKKQNPELRFAGNEIDWKKSKMRDISTINQGLQISISNRFKSKIPNSYFYITNEFLKEGAKTKYYIQNPPESVLCTEEDILMTRTGNTGEVVTDVNGAFHNNFFKIKYDSDIDKSFLVSFLRSERTQKLIGELAGVSTIPDLNHNDFYNIEIYHPNKNEQSQIGSFLKNVNKLISKHQNKQNRLQTLKKSMLDKMFPKEGQTVPEIRFKGFEGDWKKCEFQEIANLKRGLTYSPSDLRKTGTRVLRSSNIFENRFIQRSDDVFVTDAAINIEYLKEGDILITSANGSMRLVGKHALITGIKGKVVHGGFMLLASSNTPHFLNASMSSSWYKKFVNLYTAGGGGSIGNLSKSDLDQQIIFVPIDENEQIKIGEYFKNIDTLISNHLEQLQKLKNFKQSLSEKMFV